MGATCPSLPKCLRPKQETHVPTSHLYFDRLHPVELEREGISSLPIDWEKSKSPAVMRLTMVVILLSVALVTCVIFIVIGFIKLNHLESLLSDSADIKGMQSYSKNRE